MEEKEVKVEKGSDADKQLPDVYYETHPTTGVSIKCKKVVVDNLD